MFNSSENYLARIMNGTLDSVDIFLSSIHNDIVIPAAFKEDKIFEKEPLFI